MTTPIHRYYSPGLSGYEFEITVPETGDRDGQRKDPHQMPLDEMHAFIRTAQRWADTQPRRLVIEPFAEAEATP